MRARSARHSAPSVLVLVGADDDEEEVELEDGSLDPGQVEGDPLEWDEAADDEVG